ncbi:MAG: DUF3135 domain-containing protein [Pseudomonadales bacterium]|nr:DUF3135 domain-containing protein [Pseudomonadales bacterium]
MQKLTQLPDFDELAEMAQQTPDELEALKRQIIEETISRAEEHNQRKLRGLQFHIDMEIRRAKSPMAACIKISEMMNRSLSDLRTSLNGEAEQSSSTIISSRLRDSSAEDYRIETSSSDFSSTGKSATVLMFPVI